MSVKQIQISGDAVGGVLCNCYRKGNESYSEKQAFEPIYRSLANPDAVKVEIGDVIEVFNNVINSAISEVNNLRAQNPQLFKQRGFYSQYINALIKAEIMQKIENEPVISQKLRIRKNMGSVYFIVKDKYALYIKRLYGMLNKPQSYPTPNSNKLFNGELIKSLREHIPVLFIGPNLDNLEGTVFVTSLVSKKEVNWTHLSFDLFTPSGVRPISADETVKKGNNVKLKPGLGKPDQKSS